MARWIRVCLAVAVLCAAVGCSGGYTLKGKVIAGTYTDLEVVTGDDSRFNEPGVGQVKLIIHRDPGQLNSELVTTGRSHSDGTFDIPIDSFGAGWMEESWLIQVERNGYSSGQMILRLPVKDQRLLVTVARGQSTPHEQREDLWEQYEKYK